MTSAQSFWDKKLVVSPYCRVSTDNEDQLNSLESQIKFFTNLIQNHPNWTLGEIYYDEGISGTSIKKRKNFNRLIKDAVAGKVQFIITKEVSRFARNTVDTLVYTRELKKHGVGVYFALDNINTLDSDGELRLTIMASIAQEESRKTSERVKWGHRRRMENGVVFGNDLLGYSLENGKLVIKPDEAELVRSIFKKFLEGRGTYVLARELRESGVKSKHSMSWAPTTVQRILRNEKYVGDLRQGKRITTDFLTHDRKKNPNQAETIYIKDHHEPIIDRETWDKVQVELSRRAPSKDKLSRHSNRYWCSGKLICGECGKSFRRSSQTNVNVKDWRCYANSIYGKKRIDAHGVEFNCSNRAINDVILMHAIKETFRFIKVNKEKLLKDCIAEIEQTQAKISEPIDIRPLQRKIDNLTALKTKTLDLLLRGVISEDDYKKQNDYYSAEIDALSAQIANAAISNNALADAKLDIQKYISEIERIVSCDLDNSEIYKEVIDKFVIYNDKSLAVHLHCLPFGIRIYYRTTGKSTTYRAETLSMKVA